MSKWKIKDFIHATANSVSLVLCPPPPLSAQLLSASCWLVKQTQSLSLRVPVQGDGKEEAKNYLRKHADVLLLGLMHINKGWKPTSSEDGDTPKGRGLRVTLHIKRMSKKKNNTTMVISLNKVLWAMLAFIRSDPWNCGLCMCLGVCLASAQSC